jgi:drug/metabolite transporter (DMT)-like permease
MVWLAVLSGMCFSVIGIAYRLGARRGVDPMQIMAVLSLAGAIFFAVRTVAAYGGYSTYAVALGFLAGATQYAVLHFVRAALRLGPLSLLWCAVMLSFVPVTLYAGAFLGERLAATHYAAVAAAVACVLVAGLGQGGSMEPAGGGLVTVPRRLAYAGVLLGILIFNSVASACLKDLSTRTDGQGVFLVKHYGDLYMAVLYAVLFAGVAVDQVVTRRPPPPRRWLLVLGGISAVGSIGGFALLMVCAYLPAAIVFTVTCVSSILFTALVATAALGERRTWAWYATIGCGLLAVALANGETIRHHVFGG